MTSYSVYRLRQIQQQIPLVDKEASKKMLIAVTYSHKILENI